MRKRLLRGLGPNVVALGLASFFTDFASEMVFPLMPFFITGTLRASAVWIGVVEGAADSFAALLRVWSGWFSDRVRRRKPFILAGYGISVAARPFFALAGAAWHVLVIRLTDRLGKGLRLAARDALLADSCDPDVRGKAFGLQRAMDHLGAAVGPVVAFALLGMGVGIRQVFLLTAIPAVAVLLTTGGLVRDIPGRQQVRVPLRLSLKPFGTDFRWYLVTIFVFTLGNASDAFILLLAPACGIAVKWVPLVWAGHSLLRTLASIPAGVLSDRVDRRWVVGAGWLVYAGCFAAFAAARTPAAYLAAIGVFALYHAMAESVQRAVVADLVPADLRGTAFGLYWFTIGLANLPAGLAFGLVWKTWSAPPAFLAAGAVTLAATAMLLRLRPLKGGSTPAPLPSTTGP